MFGVLLEHVTDESARAGLLVGAGVVEVFAAAVVAWLVLALVPCDVALVVRGGLACTLPWVLLSSDWLMSDLSTVRSGSVGSGLADTAGCDCAHRRRTAACSSRYPMMPSRTTMQPYETAKAFSVVAFSLHSNCGQRQGCEDHRTVSPLTQ